MRLKLDSGWRRSRQLRPWATWTVYVGAVGILLLARPAAAKPLSADDIATLLASVSQKRVAALIDEKGISFEASATEKAKLRAAGAGDEVIDAVDRAAVAAGRRPEAEHRATSEAPHGAAEASGKPTPASAKASTQAAKATQQKPATAKGQGPEGMVFVPGGPFVMGCNEQVDAECDEDEKPSKTVEVGPFWIDKTEVTVASYRRCVDAGRCSDIGLSTAFWDGKEQTGSSAHCNWGKAARADHPINCVSWDEAVAYCEVHGKRLPTEAEWEKAARGTDRRKYAWGNAGYAASGPVANIADAAAKATISGRDIPVGYSDGSAYTAPVGSFPAGASPYGALDMIGNVWEWVADPVKDGRGVRGGSWETRPRDARVSNRYWAAPTDRDPGNGFRCAQ